MKLSSKIIGARDEPNHGRRVEAAQIVIYCQRKCMELTSNSQMYPN